MVTLLDLQLRQEGYNETSTPTEAEFTDDQINQMEGEAWESSQNSSETTTNNQFNV